MGSMGSSRWNLRAPITRSWAGLGRVSSHLACARISMHPHLNAFSSFSAHASLMCPEALSLLHSQCLFLGSSQAASSPGKELAGLTKIAVLTGARGPTSMDVNAVAVALDDSTPHPSVVDASPSLHLDLTSAPLVG